MQGDTDKRLFRDEGRKRACDLIVRSQFGEKRAGIADDVMAQLARVDRSQAARSRVRVFPVVAWAAVAACLALAVGAYVRFSAGRAAEGGQSSPELTAKLVSMDGGVALHRAGESVLVRPGMVLRTGDELAVSDGAHCSVLYLDLTRLQLAAGSRLTFQPDAGLENRVGKRLYLVHGRLTVEAAAQPAGRPMIVRTAHATAEVVGTRFVVSVDQGKSRLDVAAGRAWRQGILQGPG